MNNPKIIFYKIKTIPFPPFLKILSFAVNSKKEVQKEKYDIIFGMGYVINCDLYRLGGGVYKKYIRASLLRYKTFSGKFLKHIRRFLNLSHWLKLYIEKENFTTSGIKFFICPSKIIADDLMENYNVAYNRIRVVYNGIDTQKFSSDNRNEARQKIRRLSGWTAADFLFLFVSSNHFLKGLEPLLDAFYLLNKEQKNTKMIVVGKGRENYFRKKSETMQLSNFVKFTGWQDDIREFYKAADCFVYPSFYDPFPNVAIESLACGTPIIVSSLTGASEIISDGKNGFVIKNPGNPAEILDKMRRAISMPEKELAAMSINARRTAENFSNEKHIKKIMEFMRSICPS